MKLRVLLFLLLVPLWLLGFVMVRVGENKDNARRSRSTKLDFIVRSDEPDYPTDKQEILA